MPSVDLINKDLSGVLIEDEKYTDVGSGVFQLNHDTILDSSNLEVWTGENKSGTQLSEGTDFALDTKIDVLSKEAVNDVYRYIEVINSDYESGELYFTYDTVGDFVQAEDINDIYNEYKARGDMDLDGYNIKNIGSLKYKETYGIHWNFETDTITRIEKSEGLTQSDFNSIYPWSDMRRCNLADNGTVNAYHGDVDYIEDGSNGQVMVEIPKFFYKRYNTSDGVIWLISEEEKEGFEVFPAFIRGGEVRDYIYIAAFEATLYDNSASNYVGDGVQYDYANDILASVADLQPISGDSYDLTRDNARQMASNRGEEWSQRDFWTTYAYQLLYLVEYANANWQSALSEGITNLDSGSSNHGQNTGHTSSLGNDSGEVIISSLENGATGATETYACSYRGIENPFGNMWEFVDGLVIKDDGYYVTRDINNFNDTGDSYNHIPINPVTDNDGYIDNIIRETDIDLGFLGSSVNGSSSTYLCDYQYSHDAGEVNIALVGGRWNSGSRAGGCCWALSDVASGSSRAISARLQFVG